MRQLTLEGRITVLKSLAVSKVLLITKLHNNKIDILYKIQKKLYLVRGKGKNYAMAMKREL